jgi:hypothetical protein
MQNSNERKHFENRCTLGVPMRPNEMAQLLMSLTRIWKVFGSVADQRSRFKIASLSLLNLRFDSVMLSKGNIIHSKIQENNTTQVTMVTA